MRATGLVAGAALVAGALTAAPAVASAGNVASVSSGPGGRRREVGRGPGRGHRQAAVEPRPEHRAADGQHHQGDDRLSRDQGGPPEPPDHRPGRGDRVRARSTTRATPACGRGTGSPRASSCTRCCSRPARTPPTPWPQAYGPGLTAFVARMNAMARLLGMSRTHFSNFDGLPYPTSYSNYSTAADLLTLGRAAMLLPAFRVGRGPAQLPARLRLRAPRLPVEEPQRANQPLSGRDRHQARLHRRRRAVPALRGVPARAHPHRRHPAQPRVHHQHERRRRHPHPELGFQPSW